MPSLDSLLEPFGLKYEDLNKAEIATLREWNEKLARKQLTVDDVKSHIQDLITGVQRALVDLEEPKTIWSIFFHRKRDVYLKARLKNYMMLLDFMTASDKAKKWIEQQIEQIKPIN